MGFINEERQQNVLWNEGKDRSSIYSPASSQRLGATVRTLVVKWETPLFMKLSWCARGPAYFPETRPAGHHRISNITAVSTGPGKLFQGPHRKWHPKLGWLQRYIHKNYATRLKSKRQWTCSFPQNSHLSKNVTFSSCCHPRASKRSTAQHKIWSPRILSYMRSFTLCLSKC